MQPLLEEDTARARGKKSVILALRYFSAAAGDALKVYFFHTNGKVIYYPYHFSNGNSLIHFESFAMSRSPFFMG
jgi:hypothetical protein